MLGKPEWFMRRKYAGWGIMPKTWQGGVYLLLILAPLFIMPYIEMTQTTMILLVLWFVFLGADMVHIMANMPKDERDRVHEAFAERNALWTIIVVLVTGFAFVFAEEIARGSDPLANPAILVVIIALFAGVIAKAATNYYLDRND
jgi:cobalamin synthase